MLRNNLYFRGGIRLILANLIHLDCASSLKLNVEAHKIWRIVMYQVDINHSLADRAVRTQKGKKYESEVCLSKQTLTN